MWIFCKQGFFSVTQHPARKDNVQIRARTNTDLEELREAFPELARCEIVETPEADYRWRIVRARWKWELVGAKLTADIDYSNFKGKMAQIPTQRHKGGLLHDVWHLHHDYQNQRHPVDPLAGVPDFFRRPERAELFDNDQPGVSAPPKAAKKAARKAPAKKTD